MDRCPPHPATSTVGNCLANLRLVRQVPITSRAPLRRRWMVTSRSKTQTIRRSAKSPTWVATARITRICRQIWQAWASRTLTLTLTRQARSMTGTGLDATTARHHRHPRTPTIRGQASQAQAEGDSGDRVQDVQSDECWAIRLISSTPKQAANVWCHLGKCYVFHYEVSVR